MVWRSGQGEIDRTLKKVQEGVELFDEIWEKVYNAQNQNQKEKFESELKSQIKKLQRYRDDIKTWITNSDIKDKRPLTDARKLIETEMERFKVCEKEFKTKAFSKEGLSQAPKEDPKEKERNKVRKWVGAALETISERKDVYEAELETINSAKKKKKDSGAAKWEDLLERCRYHEERLELILRLIDNETVVPEDVDQIKDQLDYLLEQMVEGNTDEVDGIDDESIYEDLGLDDLGGDEPLPEAPPEKPEKVADTKTPDKKGKGKEKEEEKEKEKKKEKASATVTELPSINAAALKSKPVTKEVPAKPAPAKELPTASPKLPAPSAGGGTAASAAAAAAGAPPTAAAATARGKAAAVPLTAAAAAAAGMRGRTEPAAPASAVLAGARVGGLPPPGAPASAAEAARRGAKDDAASAALAALGGAKPGGAAASPYGAAAAAGIGGLPAPGSRTLPGVGLGSEGGGGLPPPPGGARADAAGAAAADARGSSAGGLGGLGAGADGGTAGDDAAASGGASTLGLHSLVPGGGSGARSGAAAPAAADGSAGAEELESFEELLALGAPKAAGAGGGAEDPALTRQMLSLSQLNMPEPADSERPRTYVPRNPYPTPNSFPQTPAPVFDAPSTFDRFDTDTLFFIFYYQQGTYQQYLAARELKKQSWRYHKKYLTWFQRHEEPKVTADDYEQGTYVYFDYETGWCQRIKSDFTFEYGFLEDELQA